MKKIVFLLFWVWSTGVFAQVPDPACDIAPIPYINLVTNPYPINVCVGDTLGWRWFGFTYYQDKLRDKRVTWTAPDGMNIIATDSISAWFHFTEAGVYYDGLTIPGSKLWWFESGGLEIHTNIFERTCSATYPITTAYCLPILRMEAQAVEACAGECVYFRASSLKQAEEWHWEADMGNISNENGDETNICFDEAGLHRILVVGSNPAGADTLEHWINILPAPMPIDTIPNYHENTLRVGDTLQLYACAEGNTYNWTPTEGLSCTDCPNPILEPFRATSLSYECAISYNGQCPLKCVYKIDTKDDIRYFAPNVFTPNGDGINDVFEIKGMDIDILNISIYDGWGNFLHKESGLNPTWNGGEYPQNVYVWKMECIDRYTGEKKVRAGDVMLLR